MTMYIAHSLGFKVDKNRGFTSTGWAKDQSKASSSGMDLQLPTSNMASELHSKVLKDGFDPNDITKTTPQYNEGVIRLATNIWNVAHEMDARQMRPAERAAFGNKFQQIDRMVEQTIGKPMTAQEQRVAKDLKEIGRAHV